MSRLLNLLTGLSVLLLLAVFAAWGWSYWRSDRVAWRWVENGLSRTAWGDVHFTSAAGGVALSTRRSITRGTGVSPTVRNDPLGWSWKTHRPPSYPRRVDGPRFDFDHWGFAWDRDRRVTSEDWGEGERTEDYANWLIILPHAALALPLVVLPLGRGIAAWRRARRRRLTAARLCRECGYDLRASPGKCPECGGGPGGA